MCSTFRRVAVAALFALPIPFSTPAAAQLIGIKSVPIATGDQFLIHPSRNLGMSGVSIALADPWLDPFLSPGTGARLGEARFFGSPVFYSVSGGDGAGRTLPVGATFGSATWFGAASLSLQQIEAADRNRGVLFLRDAPTFEPLSERSANNMYAFGMIGRTLPGSRFSLGVSVLYADLEALDGVDLLYALSQRIVQSGHMADFRVGLAGVTANGANLEAVLVHHRMNMTHEITMLDWGCCVDPPPEGPSYPRWRTDTELDRTNTWGAHVGYDRPIGRDGWRAGGILTANRKSHPKIPNYEIMNIPRDPGDSWAFNLGAGLSRTAGPTVFGIDVIWEPIWSDTWAEADSTLVSPAGHTLKKGDRTIENDFTFANAVLRTGVLHETARWGVSAGIEVRSYSFDLEQTDNVLRTTRDQHESWMEWTPSWGGSLRFSELEVRYNGHLTTGSGRPGVTWLPEARVALDALADFIIAPSGPLTLQDARIVTHQLMVSLPIR